MHRLVMLCGVFVLVVALVDGAAADSILGDPPVQERADAIVVLVPHETVQFQNPGPQDRPLRGSVASVEKGPTPQTIMLRTGVISNHLIAGQPIKLFLAQAPDQVGVYYIIGSHPLGRTNISSADLSPEELAAPLPPWPPGLVKLFKPVDDPTSHQGADAVVVIVPDKTYRLDLTESYEREIRGTITRIDKGPTPHTIIQAAGTFIAALRAGEPIKLYLMEEPNRAGVYRINGVQFLAPPGEAKP